MAKHSSREIILVIALEEIIADACCGCVNEDQYRCLLGAEDYCPHRIATNVAREALASAEEEK